MLVRNRNVNIDLSRWMMIFHLGIAHFSRMQDRAQEKAKTKRRNLNLERKVQKRIKKHQSIDRKMELVKL